MPPSWFRAITATNADDAIALLEARNDIRLIFTDINLPGALDGMKLAAAARRRWPPIEIIIVSGHHLIEANERPERVRFFAKQYDREQVSATMKTALVGAAHH